MSQLSEQRNTLHAPLHLGFEKDEVLSAEILTAERLYQEKLKSLFTYLRAGSKRPDKGVLLTARSQIQSLQEWIKQIKMGRLWQRRLRDLADAKGKIDFCLKRLAN